MTVYGLRGFTHHGWSVTLTVLSPAGRSAALRHMHRTEGLRTIARPDALTQYHEIREGGVATLIERYGIELLDREAWEAKKAELGEAAYR